MTKRKKPDFFRQAWHKFHRLGKKVKSRRKWRAAKGGDSKIRLRERGKPLRPTIGWGSNKSIRGLVNGMEMVRVERLEQLENFPKNKAIIIASVGKKRRNEIIKKANEMEIKILNKYKEKKDAIK